MQADGLLGFHWLSFRESPGTASTAPRLAPPASLLWPRRHSQAALFVVADSSSQTYAAAADLETAKTSMNAAGLWQGR